MSHPIATATVDMFQSGDRAVWRPRGLGIALNVTVHRRFGVGQWSVELAVPVDELTRPRGFLTESPPTTTIPVPSGSILYRLERMEHRVASLQNEANEAAVAQRLHLLSKRIERLQSATHAVPLEAASLAAVPSPRSGAKRSLDQSLAASASAHVQLVCADTLPPAAAAATGSKRQKVDHSPTRALDASEPIDTTRSHNIAVSA
jgi:hypothetical protein